MNVRHAAEYLSARGYQCSPGTVRALVRADRVKCYRGPSHRGPMQFPEHELDRFLRDELIGGGPKAEKPAPSPTKTRAKREPVKSGADGADLTAMLKRAREA